MTALPLFDPLTKARRTDPVTSHVAARSASELAETHHRAIRDYLDGIYPMAASYEDISKGTGIEKHAIGRRMKEAVEERKYAEVAGHTILSTGRPGQTWQARIA